MTWKPSILTREHMEERRLEGGRLLKAGKPSQAEIARQLGVSRATVSEWAKTVQETGIGVETAALSFGLDFKPLTTERYDLIIPSEKWDSESVQALKKWLITKQTKSAINNLGGYNAAQTGTVTWVS